MSQLAPLTVKALRDLAHGDDVATLTKAQLIARIEGQPRIERGDGWEMRLGMWQDSPPEGVDVVISDPPFTDHVSQNQRRNVANHDWMPGEKVLDETDLSFGGISPADHAAFLAAARRWVLCWCAVEQVGEYVDMAGDQWVRAAVWVKTNPTPQFSGDRPAMWGEACAIMHAAGERKRWNGGGKAGLYRGAYEMRDRVHETQKPLWLMLALVDDFTDPGELVWDPYAGSATTGVACLHRGRRFIGHEMQERYFDAACERLRAAERGQGLGAYRAGQEVLL